MFLCNEESLEFNCSYFYVMMKNLSNLIMIMSKCYLCNEESLKFNCIPPIKL